MPDARGGRAAIAAAIVAGVVVVAVMMLAAVRLPLSYDESVYLGIARELGRGVCPVRPEGAGTTYMNNPPLVMVVASVARALGVDGIAGIRCFHVAVWGVGLVVATGIAAARGFGARGAVVALLLLASLDETLRSAARVELDVPLATVTIAFVAVLVDPRRDDPRFRGRSWPAFLLAASAVLIRYTGVFVGVCGAVSLVLLARRRHPTRWRECKGAVVGCLAGTVAGGLVWVATAQACGGDLVSTIAHNFDRIAAGTPEPWFRRPLVEYWSSLAGWMGPLLGGAVLLALVVRRRDLGTTPALLLPLVLVCVHLGFCSMIGLKAERYFISGLAAMVVLGSGVVGLRDRMARRASRMLAGGVLLGGAVAVAGAIANLPDAGLNAYYARVGAVVAAHSARDDRVLLPHVQVAYFADRHYRVSLFERDPDTVLRWLKDPSERITVIALDDRLHAFHPELPLADRERIESYVAAHFEQIDVGEPHALVFVRRGW